VWEAVPLPPRDGSEEGLDPCQNVLLFDLKMERFVLYLSRILQKKQEGGGNSLPHTVYAYEVILETFQAIKCTDTDNQAQKNQEIYE